MITKNKIKKNKIEKKLSKKNSFNISFFYYYLATISVALSFPNDVRLSVLEKVQGSKSV